MNHKTRIVTLVVFLAGAGGYVAFAGPLDPPLGPVAPTYKTLSEVEPRIAVNATNTPGDADSLFQITQAGSYYLTGNISGVAGKHGIEITASGVTLDLMGFDLVGVAGSLDGVVGTNAPTVNITVRNGSARSWGGNGVNLFNAASNTIVSDITSYFNGAVGIAGGFGGVISHCASYANVGNGIQVGSVTTVTECVASSNQGSGISVGAGCVVSNCATRFNSLDGIIAFRGCLIRNNTCTNNGLNAGSGAGIHVTDVDNSIEGNNCIGADRGIDVDVAGNIIIRNTCSGNTTNWDIVIGNAVAPIVAASTNAAAIFGNTYAGSLGSTDPNANFTY